MKGFGGGMGVFGGVELVVEFQYLVVEFVDEFFQFVFDGEVDVDVLVWDGEVEWCLVVGVEQFEYVEK